MSFFYHYNWSMKTPKQKSWLRRFLPFYKPVMGLFLLDSLFAVILAGVAVGTPFLTQWITKSAMGSDYQAIGIGIGMLVSILFIKMISHAVITKWGHIMGIRMEVNMRRKAIKKMQSLPMSHFDKTDTGTYISRIVSDLKDIPEFAHHAPEDFIVAVLISVGGFTYAFLQSWIIGVILLGVFVVGIVVIYLIRSKWRVIWTKVRKHNSEMSASVGFQVEGISEIKSFDAANFERKRFDKFQDGYKNAYYKLYKFEAIFTVANVMMMSLTSLVTLAIGSFLLADNKITVPQLIGLTSAAAMLTSPMQKFVNVYVMLSRGESSIERFFEFMDLPEESLSGTKRVKKLKGDIEFKNVDFSYIDDKNKKVVVLDKFNLKIKSGQKIAIIGETGIGKSTILKLLLRFYDIQGGEILVDGINVNDYKVGDLRQRLGYVQQMPGLFHDTIKNNILYGKPKATMAEIKKAAKDAQIDKFIDNLKDGYNTVAGPRGAKLSGGQKQRIAIARTFIAHADVLLMDEATSALDNETEQQIKKALDKLSKGKTSIIIAHRLSTIKEVDRIIVMGKGGVVFQEGTHDELIKKDGYYKDMNF